MAIHAVESACSRNPTAGDSVDRSKGEMLSRPMKPPSNRLSCSRSLLSTHQVKLISSLWKIRARNSKSACPSISNTRIAAQAWTGGLTSEKFHS